MTAPPLLALASGRKPRLRKAPLGPERNHAANGRREAFARPRAAAMAMPPHQDRGLS